jgi:hypothetical protein
VNFGEGIISKIYRWVWHPGVSDESVTDWVAFLALAIIVSFLWTTVIAKVD